MNTVIINNKELRLNSGLDEQAFGKTNYYTLINQEGLIFDGASFSPWTFEKIIAEPVADNSSDIRVFYCGKNPLSNKAKTLLSYFNEYGDIDKGEDDKNESLYKIVVEVVKAMTTAIDNNINLPIVGAGGIIIDNSSNKILFLPENIFKYSTNSLNSEDYFAEHTAWVNKTISGPAAIYYQRSVIVYKFLTGRYPYPEIDEEERTTDILSTSFLPLGQCITGINIDFAKTVNKGLRLNSTTISSNKKTETSTNELILDSSFDFDLFDEAWQLRKTITLSDEEFSNKVKIYLATQKARIATQKKLKKYFVAFMISFFAALGIILFIFNSTDKQNSSYTSKGLTSTEIVQGFFYGVNNKKIDLLESLTDGDNPEKFVSQIQSIFLLNKQIAGFTGQEIYYNPAQWLYIITTPEAFKKVRVHGITNLHIDNIPYTTEIEVHRKNQKPQPIISENGTTLKQEQIVSYNVEYYLLETNPDTSEIIVTKESDNFTLTYRNQKWLITKIISNQEIVPVDTEVFTTDYFAALETNKGDQILATNSLKEKYDWLPTNETMLNEQSYLLANY